MITVESAIKDGNTRKAVEAGSTDESKVVAKKARTKKLLIAGGVIAAAYFGYKMLNKSKGNGEIHGSM